MLNFFNSKNLLFSLLITTLQISFILSADIKCYSIKNCAVCPELDICEKCSEGFTINKSKTKCKGEAPKKSAPAPAKVAKNTPPPKVAKPSPSPQPAKPSPPPAQPAKPSPPPAQPAQPSPKPSPSPVKSNSNPFLQKPSVSVNKAPNNPFQNIPTPSFQRFKDKEANNALINKILIFILIALVLSIIVSLINNYLKKMKSKGYMDEEGQEETSKVVSIH